ncbi:MAG: phospholipid/glycerol acyltransferase [Chloroflexi bacterium]|nr:MAG: phospholipid/glycerol acyltransferase [Chloroflexota bacterium]
MESQMIELSESLIDELVGAVGLTKNKINHTIFWLLFRRITNRLAALGAPFDQLAGEKGLPEASAWCLTHFCNPIKTRGGENIPEKGPLLLVSNHPGAYDGLVLFSQLKRRDVCWISSEIHFLNMLKNTREHILFASRSDASNRMLVMRNAIRHLRSGGVLVYFASGHRDPDPAVYDGAESAMDEWLDVFDTFIKYVPGLKILPAVVSGVVSPYWAHHPITWLRRKQIDKHRLAEFGQVITQLMRPGRLMISPAVSFGLPVSESELRQEAVDMNLRAAVIERGKSLLKDHCANVAESN